MKMIATLLLCIFVTAGSTSFASAAAMPAEKPFVDPFEKSVPVPETADPLEPLNRGSFWLNDKLYTYLLSPLCDILPRKYLEDAECFLEKLTSPVRSAHAEFNLRFRDAGSEFRRIALSGLISLVESIHPEGFFQAFGWDPGTYLVLPLFGPSTLGDGVEGALLELTARGKGKDDSTTFVEDLETYQTIRKTALDPYLFVRDAYRQQMEAGNKKYIPAGRFASLQIAPPHAL